MRVKKAKRIEAARSRNFNLVDAAALNPGDLVLVEIGDLIPSDGDVVEAAPPSDRATAAAQPAPLDMPADQADSPAPKSEPKPKKA